MIMKNGGEEQRTKMMEVWMMMEGQMNSLGVEIIFYRIISKNFTDAMV